MTDYSAKLIKDTSTFRDAVACTSTPVEHAVLGALLTPRASPAMLSAQAGFGTAFATIFQPMAGESGLSSAHPEAASTLREIAGYQDLMAELREAIQPELDLIDTRVAAPLKEYQELLKKIRKTITKRDHKVSLGEMGMGNWN